MRYCSCEFDDAGGPVDKPTGPTSCRCLTCSGNQQVEALQESSVEAAQLPLWVRGVHPTATFSTHAVPISPHSPNMHLLPLFPPTSMHAHLPLQLPLCPLEVFEKQVLPGELIMVWKVIDALPFRQVDLIQLVMNPTVIGRQVFARGEYAGFGDDVRDDDDPSCREWG